MRAVGADKRLRFVEEGGDRYRSGVFNRQCGTVMAVAL